MQMCCFKTPGTLSKAEKIDKFMKGVAWGTLIILTFFYANCGFAATIPVTLTWLPSPGRTPKYMIEISDDSRFGTSTAKTEVSGNHLLWQAPKEGVYHWRVTPMDRMKPAADAKEMVETSSIASGSFLVLDAGPEAAEPVTIRWSDDPSVIAYHLKIQEDGRDTRVLVSLVPTYNLLRSAKPLALQIIPRGKSSTNKIAKDAVARFDPNLQIVPKVEAPPAAPPPARELLVGDQPIPQEQPHVYEALPAAPAAVVFEEPVRDEVLLPENRVMELLVAGFYGTEKTYSASGPLTTRLSEGNAVGGMISYRAIPVPGLHLQASGTMHARKASWKDQNNVEVTTQQTSTYFGEVGVGGDVFFRNPNRRHQLVLDVRGAMASSYDLPYETADLASLNLKSQDLQLWGGGLWYRWTARRWGLGGHAAALVQTVNRKRDNDASLNEWGLFASVDPVAYVTISLGAWSRHTIVRRCSSDTAVCAANGASAARTRLNAGYLGVGYVIY